MPAPSNRRAALLAEAEKLANLGSYVWYLPDGPIEWSDQLFRIFGMDPASDAPDVEAFFGLIHEDDRSRMTADLDEIIAGRIHGGSDVFRIRRSGDGAVRFLASRWVVEDATDGSLRLYGTLRDVTDVQASQLKLERTMEALAEAQRVANVGSFEWDVSVGRITWSEQLHRILGYSRDVTPSEAAWRARVHPDDRPRLDRGWTGVLEGGKAGPTEFRLLLPRDEVRRVVLDARTYFDDSGRVVRVRGVVMDVTERRRLEERLQQTQKMEAVGRLAGGIAHDFNNLLTVILANVARLRKGPDPRALDSLESAVETAAGLTRSLLSFSRRAMLRPRVVDVNQTVKDALPLVERLVAEHIEVRFTPAEGQLPTQIDEPQIHQVLMNLASNARDAMPEGGTFEIRLERRSIPSQGEYASIEVRDTGVGMTDEVKSRAFEPFFTTKAVGQGTGLGLATVFGIVSQSGGMIELSSEPGKGTRFQLLFPLVNESPETSGSTPLTAKPRPARVLIVDDNHLVRAPLEQLLRDAGHDVSGAGNLLEAMARWNEAPFDVVVTDVVMPEGSGPKMVGMLRQHAPDLPVIFMTGYAAEKVPVEGRRVEVLQKPFTEAELLSALGKVLG